MLLCEDARVARQALSGKWNTSPTAHGNQVGTYLADTPDGILGGLVSF